MTADSRKVFIKTYGCQMNVYDSTRMADALARAGYGTAETMDDADLVLLNTCHIREKAAEKVYSELGRVRKAKEARSRDGKPMLVGITGCVAQAEGAEIPRRAPLVDLVVGPQSYHVLPELLSRAERGETVVETEFPAEDKFDHLPAPDKARVAARGPTAFLTVQEGCDKFCTFCVVPYTRGSEVSRPASQILGEARALVAAGVREITLLGQNVNAYHGVGPDGGDWGLGRLLHELAGIDGLERLRYTTSHPRDMDEALIAAHRDLPMLMPYLHLPVQSGSDRILAAMNRRHDRNAYLRLVERIRRARPDIALSGDFIVGFPGETDQDFADTLDLIARVGYAQAYSFKYSPRPGTPGADLGDQVDEDVKNSRLQALQALLTQQQQAFNTGLVGRSIEVLFERIGRRPGQLVGRSPWLQPVHVEAPPALLGSMGTVRIASASANSLAGVLLDTPTVDIAPRESGGRQAWPVKEAAS